MGENMKKYLIFLIGIVFLGCTQITVNVPENFRGKLTISEEDEEKPATLEQLPVPPIGDYYELMSATGASYYVVSFTSLTGGGTGALDAIECEDIKGNNSNTALTTGSVAVGQDGSGNKLNYVYDSTGTDAEGSSITSVSPIVPDDQVLWWM